MTKVYLMGVLRPLLGHGVEPPAKEVFGQTFSRISGPKVLSLLLDLVTRPEICIDGGAMAD